MFEFMDLQRFDLVFDSPEERKGVCENPEVYAKLILYMGNNSLDVASANTTFIYTNNSDYICELNYTDLTQKVLSQTDFHDMDNKLLDDEKGIYAYNSSFKN